MYAAILLAEDDYLAVSYLIPWPSVGNFAAWVHSIIEWTRQPLDIDIAN